MKDFRRIICTNKDGYSIAFGEKSFSPFLLVDADGCYEASNSVTVSENTMIDGGSYQGSVASVRNIVLTVADVSNYVENRNLLYRLFKAGEAGRLVFHEMCDGEETKRYTDYYVEKIEGTGKNGCRQYQMSLICPDPFFYDMEDVRVSMAAWISDFTFPHAFRKWEELGHRSDVRLQDIRNDTATDRIGISVSVYANGEVRYYTDVATGTERDISQYLTEDSEFVQLGRGDNTIGYDAESGAGNMTITITYRLRYAGA